MITPGGSVVVVVEEGGATIEGRREILGFVVAGGDVVVVDVVDVVVDVVDAVVDVVGVHVVQRRHEVGQ